MAVHFLLIFGVAAYTLFGALVMQWIESPSSSLSKNVQKRSVFYQNGSAGGREPRETRTRVFRGPEVALLDPQVHLCVETAVDAILTRTRCDPDEIEHVIIADIDRCYQEVGTLTFDSAGGPLLHCQGTSTHAALR